MSNIQKSNPAAGSSPLSKANLGAKMMTKALGVMTRPRIFRQLCLFVIDGSGSMYNTTPSGIEKCVEVDNRMKELLKRMQSSKNSNCFDIAVIAYADDSKIVLPTTNLTEIAPEQVSYNPCDYVEGQTYLLTAMEKAESMLINYLINDSSQALILLLSDGAIFDMNKVTPVVERIQSMNNVTVSASLIEDDAWIDNYGGEDAEEIIKLENNLRSMTSSAEFFIRSNDITKVRDFMHASIRSVSGINY